jgi:hypothetical protein
MPSKKTKESGRLVEKKANGFFIWQLVELE